MKILLILEYYYPNIGGLEKLFKQLADKLAADGHQITVLTNRISEDQPWKEQTGNVTILRYRFRNRYLFTLLALFPALRLARNADLIQTTSYNAGFPAFLAGWLSGKKVVITFHEVWGKLWYELPYMGRFSKMLHATFEQFLLKLPFTRFVAVSEFTRRKLHEAGIKSNRITRIYNGIEYEKLQMEPLKGQSNNRYTFLYFGRLGISKGLDVLLEAIEHLSKEATDFTVILVLPRKPVKMLTLIHRDIEKRGISENVSIRQELSNEELVQQIRGADAVIIPSYSEGFCFTAAETVALGQPIISSHQGALPEVVGGNFLSYDNQDPVLLAKAMKTALEGRWDYKEPRRFHLDDTIKEYIALYKKLLSEK